MFSFSPILLEETVLGVVLFIALVVSAVMTAIFRYHWKRFGIPTPLFRKMTRVYFWTSGAFAALSVVLYVTLLANF